MSFNFQSFRISLSPPTPIYFLQVNEVGLFNQDPKSICSALLIYLPKLLLSIFFLIWVCWRNKVSCSVEVSHSEFFHCFSMELSNMFLCSPYFCSIGSFVYSLDKIQVLLFLQVCHGWYCVPLIERHTMPASPIVTLRFMGGLRGGQPDPSITKLPFGFHY